MEINYCTPQQTYLIIEQIHSKAGLPSYGNIGPGLFQVFRRVHGVCLEEDVFFDGQRLDGPPTEWHLLQELLRPGKQITTRPTGEKRLSLVYSGFKNLVSPLPKIGGLLPEAWTKEYDLGTPPTPYRIGEDPIPHVQLYGNPRVEFVMQGGSPPPVAVGIYRASTKQLKIPTTSERERVIKGLIQKNPGRH